MTRRDCGVLCIALAVLLVLGECSDLMAQDNSDDDVRRRAGGYLSLLKIGLIALIFLIWVRFADWVNRDSQRLGKRSGMKAEVWNPIMVLFFLLTFIAAISVPIFWAGYPVFVIGALAPPLTYALIRRSKIKADPSLLRAAQKAKGKEITYQPEVMPQDEGAEIEFTPAGDDDDAQRANLIRARQTGGFKELKELIVDAQFKRADQLMLDYTREAALPRILVDGIWHKLPSIGREQGDQLLASLKYLAGLNPAERRAKQSGRIGIKSDLGKSKVRVSSQGITTGERVAVKFEGGDQDAQPLDQLGMLPEMHQQVRESLNHSGLTIISAPPGHGLTSSWQGALLSSDRLTRDCIGFVNPEETETDVENIMVKHYDLTKETQLNTLRAILLTQPDMLAVPQVEDKEVMDLLVKQADQQDRAIVFRTPARSAAEALLRVYAQANDRATFLKTLRVVTGQRLLRRLCPDCRVEVRVQPQMIQKLGGDPKTQGTLFNQYKLPPPEQRVDENGKPIEIPPCETCGGIGYIGRIAAFEMLKMSDPLRELITKTPKAAAIESAAIKLGKKSLAQEAYQLVLLGVTSLAEVQRVLQEKQ
jgi:type II secretory ATPase GspE/PulE/Tfp pilus assembly ATPase PilB-like protein